MSDHSELNRDKFAVIQIFSLPKNRKAGAMLRAATKQAIYNLLDDSYFGASNFSIEYGDADPHWLELTFIPDANFIFSVEANVGGMFIIKEAPGLRLLKSDIASTTTFDDAVKRISKWIERIKEEVIDANPINRELQDVRKQLQERMDALGERQDEFFTKAEAEDVAEKLRVFASKLDSLAEQNLDLRSEIDRIKGRLSELSEAAEQVNKGTWLRMAGSRILSVAKITVTSKEGREFALEAAKKLLLDPPK